MISPISMTGIVAIIEVEGADSAETPAHLIRDAYLASRHGVIGLWLHGTTPQAVDRVLDPTVARVGREVCGIRYFSADDEQSIGRAATSARFAIASSDDFRARLARLGVPCLRPNELVQCLEDYIRHGLQREPLCATS